jgi:hypothetical protein
MLRPSSTGPHDGTGAYLEAGRSVPVWTGGTLAPDREIKEFPRHGLGEGIQGGSMKALEKGAYIKHFQYGLGVVTESNADRTSIDFDLHGPKKFVTTIMVVEHAEGTPPRRKRARKKAAIAVIEPAGSK